MVVLAACLVSGIEDINNVEIQLNQAVLDLPSVNLMRDDEVEQKTLILTSLDLFILLEAFAD